MAIWTPDLAGRRGPKYLQIVDALSDDIASGVLAAGARLPPHRELAYALGMSPNTTSRAYAEGVNRSLLVGEVGRGTFVRAPGAPSPLGQSADLRRATSGPIDLSRNLPAPGPAARHLDRALAELRRGGDLRTLLDYQTDGDPSRHTQAALSWLGRAGIVTGEDEVVITNGAQHGIFCALMAISQPGDLLLVEALSYAPVRVMAERLGLKLATVAMDEGGLRPDALSDLCKSSGANALYVTPTLQSPTTVTMTEDRRRDIAGIARRHDIVLIEDDVFGLLKPAAPPPITTFAPDRAIFITSTSKCIAPGLRVGFVRAPAGIAAAVRDAVNLTCWMTAPLMTEIATRWILDGSADVLTEQQRQTASRRQRLARSILGDHTFAADAYGLHLWLALPKRWKADAFRAEAKRRNVMITEGAAFAANPAAAPNAVRLCLSHEPDESRLRLGLETIATLLATPPTSTGLFL